MKKHSPALDSVFHALADPTRRAVIQRLGNGPASVSELAAPFNMTLPSFGKHIAVLEQSHLITSRKLGRVRTCSLALENLATAEHWFGELRARWASRYDKLDNLLDAINGDNNDD